MSHVPLLGRPRCGPGEHLALECGQERPGRPKASLCTEASRQLGHARRKQEEATGHVTPVLGSVLGLLGCDLAAVSPPTTELSALF